MFKIKMIENEISVITQKPFEGFAVDNGLNDLEFESFKSALEFMVQNADFFAESDWNHFQIVKV